MAIAPTLSIDLLLCVAGHLGARDLLNLGATQQSLQQPLTRRAFTVALTAVPFDHDLKPVTHAIQNGDIPLLSKTMGFLDALFPEGWQWSRFYAKDVGRLLTVASAHNLESLQYLAQKYPLTLGPSDSVALFNIRNWELVIEALKRDKYDCAAFLLNYQPPLFPNGFPLKANPACYSSPATLNFLVGHGAYLGVNPLHDIAALDLRDTQVFDILVQRGFGVDAPLVTFRHLSTGSMYTPLHEACRGLQPRSIEALLRLGANPNGATGSFFVNKVPLMGGFQYSSPLPILTLLLSSQWDIGVSVDLKALGRRLVDCFQLLLHYGATTSIPLLNGNLLEILVLRIWRILYKQTTRQPDFSLPEDQGVQSFLLALDQVDCSPWDHVCEVFSDIIPMWSSNAEQTRGKGRLVRLLSDYQDKFGDLPGPAQLRQSFLFTLPDRYVTGETNSI